MRWSYAKLTLLCFAVLGIAGIWHGFPLIDVYADEMYYAYGPLYSFAHFWPFPHHVPYGTVTFYLVLPLQVIVLSITALAGLLMGQPVAELIMQYPFLAYIASRVLSFILFLAMVWLTVEYCTQRAVAPLTRWIVPILWLNLVLLTFMHSGKMWITSLFFLVVTGLFFHRSPRISMAAAGVAFANFPIMGIFWVLCFFMHWRRPHDASTRRVLVWIALAVPSVIMLLNFQNIIAQVASIFGSDIALAVPSSAKHAGGILVWLQLYVTTLGSYVLKLLFTSPVTLLLAGVAVFSHARVRDRSLFTFAVLGAALYLLAMGLMFYSAGIHTFYRYLMPFHALAILAFASLDIPTTRLTRISVASLGIVSLYLAVVSSLSLALPTTYNQAHRTILSQYSEEGTIILSTVAQITLPYTKASAQLTQSLTPDACSNRCHYALEHTPDTSFQGLYFFVPRRPELADRVRRLAQGRGWNIVTVTPDPSDEDFVSVEHKLGSYFIKEAWVPSRLGQRILIEGR